MANIFEAANFLLEHRAKTTAWQLQKLCYYSKAWGLSICGEPIFDESFEAWANGPVCRRLYFRHRGKKYIPQNLFASYSSENVSEYGRAIMLAVLRKYGDLTGEELRELSHRELPWKKTREGIPDGENCEKMIPDNLIVEFYSGQASDFKEIENAMLYFVAKERVSGELKTCSFEDMMAKFGIKADDLEDEDVEFEMEPLFL